MIRSHVRRRLVDGGDDCPPGVCQKLELCHHRFRHKRVQPWKAEGGKEECKGKRQSWAHATSTCGRPYLRAKQRGNETGREFSAAGMALAIARMDTRETSWKRRMMRGGGGKGVSETFLNFQKGTQCQRSQEPTYGKLHWLTSPHGMLRTDLRETSLACLTAWYAA